MVSLPGDVAPERVGGFYEETAPARELVKRQLRDVPPRNFLVAQSGYHVGIPNPHAKLRNIDGFMHATTNYRAVQNAPHYMRLRYKHVRERALADQAKRKAHFHKLVHSKKADRQAYLKRQLERKPAEILRSPAAGLLIKQALRSELVGGPTEEERKNPKYEFPIYGRDIPGDEGEPQKKAAGPVAPEMKFKETTEKITSARSLEEKRQALAALGLASGNNVFPFASPSDVRAKFLQPPLVGIAPAIELPRAVVLPRNPQLHLRQTGRR